MDFNFSQEATALISEARLCAIDLGSDHISTVHLFLADCKSDNPYSIKDFVFKTTEEFQQFFNSQGVAEASFLDAELVGSLPITLEMEQTIFNAQKQYKQMLQPHHFFLAASLLKESLFYLILDPKEGLYERLRNYYTQKGITIIDKTVIDKTEKKSFWKHFTRR